MLKSVYNHRESCGFLIRFLTKLNTSCTGTYGFVVRFLTEQHKPFTARRCVFGGIYTPTNIRFKMLVEHLPTLYTGTYKYEVK